MKRIVKIVFIICSLVEFSYASPGLNIPSGSSSTDRRSSGGRSSKFSSPVGSSGRSAYTGLNGHEAAAERQRELEAQYQEQLKAQQEGRAVPTTNTRGKGSRREDLEAARARREEIAEAKRVERAEKQKEREELIKARKSRSKRSATGDDVGQTKSGQAKQRREREMEDDDSDLGEELKPSKKDFADEIDKL